MGAKGIDGAYSYGIQGHDEWGEAVSREAGCTVQYDCLNATRPSCVPPCHSMFHDECIAGSIGRPKHKPLKDHLETNGHATAADGSLIMKIDIDGPEWDTILEI